LTSCYQRAGSEVFWSYIERWNYQVYLPPAYRRGGRLGE
jgi:hypothetical protein